MEQPTVKRVLVALLAFALLWLGAAAALLASPALVLFARYEPVRRRIEGFDRVVNAFWMFGNPLETVSAHAGRIIATGKGSVGFALLVKRLTDVVEQDHVLKAYASERQRMQETIDKSEQERAQ